MDTGMDGFAFRVEQRRDPILAAIPIVVVTADGDHRGKGAALQAAAAIGKPLQVDTLLDVVSRVCAMKPPADS
jgi:CheY-like chemotaxis protein